MDPRSSPPMMLAPGAASRAVSAPSFARAPREPDIDENVLGENSTHEIVDGQVFELAPAGEDHGSEHFLLPSVLGVHLAPGYKGTVDMLTRPSMSNNFAPDVSIVAKARDPKTGGRQVEDLVFEVIDTETLAHVTDKTRKLIERGIRRAFLIDVTDRSVCEWSREIDDWVGLAEDATIVDRCFAVPVPVRALVDEMLNENTVAESLLARRNSVIGAALVEEREAGREAGREDGRRAALRTLARVAGIVLSADDDRRIDACGDAAVLDRWVANGRTATTAEELLR